MEAAIRQENIKAGLHFGEENNVVFLKGSNFAPPRNNGSGGGNDLHFLWRQKQLNWTWTFSFDIAGSDPDPEKKVRIRPDPDQSQCFKHQRSYGKNNHFCVNTGTYSLCHIWQRVRQSYKYLVQKALLYSINCCAYPLITMRIENLLRKSQTVYFSCGIHTEMQWVFRLIYSAFPFTKIKTNYLQHGFSSAVSVTKSCFLSFKNAYILLVCARKKHK